MPQIHAPLADKMLTEKQRQEYLDALTDPSVTPDQAAKLIGLTGTKMRALRRRDPGWEMQCRDAEVERAANYADELVAEARARKDVSDRILEVELASHGGPVYAHLRRDRVKVDAQVTGVVIQLDPSTLDQLPTEEKRQLRDALAKLGGRVIEQGQPQIEGGAA